MASKLANEIFFKNDFKSLTDKTKKWKAKVKMCKTFMFYQTLKAFIWRNTYANVNSMFDVSGENHDSNNMSNKQKAMLVDIDFPQIYDDNYKLTSFYNAEGLYTNYFLHHWQTISASCLVNAVAFTTSDVEE